MNEETILPEDAIEVPIDENAVEESLLTDDSVATE